MSEKRRDNKGRLLQSGERQRKDGRYEYRYLDTNGNKHSVYSWRLVSTDKTPTGKKCEGALRDIKREIIRDLEDHVMPSMASKKTLNQYYEEYVKSKYGLKGKTKANYNYLYNKRVRESIGNERITSLKYSDIKKFYNSLITEGGLKPSSVSCIHTIIHPVFTLAIRDGVIKNNPSDGAIREIKKCQEWSQKKRHALTVPEQEAFVSFCKNNKKFHRWLPLFTFLLGTGCRIGEACGLRWEDCDFDDNLISINRNLSYCKQDGRSHAFVINTPKTGAGKRIIPMLGDVKKALLMEQDIQKTTGRNTSEVEGLSGFVFMSSRGSMLIPQNVDYTIKRICKLYNSIEGERAKVENREPLFLPQFSVHQLRHTFCTRFCENETNIKIVQEIMGHADISTTMNVYNEATLDKKMESFKSLEGKIKVL